MFAFIKTWGKNKQMEHAIAKVDMNMSNNYKDAAQADYKELQMVYKELLETNSFSEKQRKYYEDIMDEYKKKMENYSHKDQKPFWQ